MRARAVMLPPPTASSEEGRSRRAPEAVALPDLATRLRFEQLARRWMDDTSLESSTTKIILHPAHLQIIGMGKPVLPLILKSLEQEEALWFCALQSITGENPVPAEDTGRIPTMIQRWLAWGRDQGLL